MKSLLKTIFFSSCLISSHLTIASLFIRPIKHTATAVITATYFHKVITGEEKDFTRLPDLSLAEVRDYYRDCKTTCNNTFESLKGGAKAVAFAPFTTDENDIHKIVEDRHTPTNSYKIKSTDHHNMSPEEVTTHSEPITMEPTKQKIDYSEKSPEEYYQDPETPHMD